MGRVNHLPRHDEGSRPDVGDETRAHDTATLDDLSPPARGRGRMADEVYDKLLAQLMSQRIVPGSRITIDALAREMGVSQTPIRDALGRMEADDLVVRIPHAGYRIPPQITRSRFEDMVEIRLLLEPAAARRAAERATTEQVARLRGVLDEMVELAEGEVHTYGAFGLRDAVFHDLVAESAGNQVVREALGRLHTHVHLFRLLYDTQVTYLAMGEHDEVLAGIAARDPDAAAYAMRRHILLSAERFGRLFADDGEDDPRFEG
ncbi:GntR family transcriptional regulator [Nocardioides anomalus]|uniref:GntR family transcriptional regulator n=1 Tax=Nocardioides anomalus TaxID=2712223 RepID=A0A6G6WM08_9ACTN|nr:GntR family transcriptional regulator [Nocardioides anomalus]